MPRVFLRQSYECGRAAVGDGPYKYKCGKLQRNCYGMVNIVQGGWTDVFKRVIM